MRFGQSLPSPIACGDSCGRVGAQASGLIDPHAIIPRCNNAANPPRMKSRKILVTYALPYANGPIHLGHMVGNIQTDIWVR